MLSDIQWTLEVTVTTANYIIIVPGYKLLYAIRTDAELMSLAVYLASGFISIINQPKHDH